MSTATATPAGYFCSALKWLLNSRKLVNRKFKCARNFIRFALSPVTPLPDALESISSSTVVVLVIGVTLLRALTILKLYDAGKVIYDCCREKERNSLRCATP